MRRVLITGAGRGLGLEFVRQCILRGDYVFASFRDTDRSSELYALTTKYPDQLNILRLDVTDSASIDESYNIVKQNLDGIDLLVNNAGVNSKSKDMGNPANHSVLGQLDSKKMLEMFRVNSVAPIIMAQTYLPLLIKGVNPKIVNISSVRASISEKMQGGNYSYCASKAALNMLTRALAFDLAQWKIIVIAIDPGWAKTDMGGKNAQITTAKSVEGMLKVIDNLSNLDTGRFLSWKGEICLW